MICVLSSSLFKSSLRSDQRDYVVFMCKHSTLAKPLDFIQDQHSGQTRREILARARARQFLARNFKENIRNKRCLAKKKLKN